MGNYSGVTIITDRLFQPLFFPNCMHRHKQDDINYYIFETYVKENLIQNIPTYNACSGVNNIFSFDKNSKSTRYDIKIDRRKNIRNPRLL